MLRVVVVCSRPLTGELVAEALRAERGVEVVVLPGSGRALRSPAVQEAMAAAQAVVYVPDRAIERLPPVEAKPGAAPAVVVADLFGLVGLERAVRLGARGYAGPEETAAALVERVLRAAEGQPAFP